ncbi:MAG: hypothetical protein IJ727_02195 [Treponema sp.]|nr:hypothetical protein [Treponema sp.]
MDLLSLIFPFYQSLFRDVYEGVQAGDNQTDEKNFGDGFGVIRKVEGHAHIKAHSAVSSQHFCLNKVVCYSSGSRLFLIIIELKKKPDS